ALIIVSSCEDLLLVAASANVATLILARSSTRQKKFAVRLALGPGRAKIVRQLLTESLLLSLAGGAAGILLAYWSVQSLVAFMSRGGWCPSRLALHLDLRVLVFTVAASGLTGMVFGVARSFAGTGLVLPPS